MLPFISLILVVVGCINWLCIGLLQFDFVAGLFGSQSNIFSRIVYVIIGIASLIISYQLIKNKGKLEISFKKFKKQMSKEKPKLATESAKDNSKDNYNTEASNDNSKNQDNNTEVANNNHKDSNNT